MTSDVWDETLISEEDSLVNSVVVGTYLISFLVRALMPDGSVIWFRQAPFTILLLLLCSTFYYQIKSALKVDSILTLDSAFIVCCERPRGEINSVLISSPSLDPCDMYMGAAHRYSSYSIMVKWLTSKIRSEVSYYWQRRHLKSIRRCVLHFRD